MQILYLGLTALLCYLLGSVNFAVLVSRRLGKDVRTCGSGNAGSTNMLRTFGWKAAIPVFLGDLLKGVCAVLLARALAPLGSIDVLYWSYLGAVCGLLGHVFPLYFGFHGGKGVATAIGVILALHPLGGALVLIVGLSIAALSGYVSMASVLCAACYPFLAYFCGGLREALPAAIMVLLILWSHRENIRRLLNHSENKFTPPPYKEKSHERTD